MVQPQIILYSILPHSICVTLGYSSEDENNGLQNRHRRKCKEGQCHEYLKRMQMKKQEK